MSQFDESISLSALRKGDNQAVLAWYKFYQPKLSAFIARRVSHQPDIEELTQETFISCLRNLPSFSHRSRLWTWMCAIAKHEIGDYYRKRYAKKVLKLLPLSDWFLPNFNHSSDQATTFETELANDLNEKMEHVWQKIGHYYQELLQQKYLDKLSVAQLARARGKTPKAIESELYRARQAFKIAYQEIDD